MDFIIIVGDDDCILTVDTPSKGTATHLGKSTWSSLSIVYANTAPPWEQTGNLVFEKKGTGDQLIDHYIGEIGTNLPDNPFLGSGDYWITSGTGKFAGVKGSGTCVYTVNTDMIGDLTFTGTLTFPKKK